MNKKTLITIIISICILFAAGFLFFYFFKVDLGGYNLKSIWNNFGLGNGLIDPQKNPAATKEFRLDTEIFGNPKFDRLKEKFEREGAIVRPGNPNPFGGG
jgi:hypothetical protein